MTACIGNPMPALPPSEYRAMADAYLAGGSFRSVAEQFGRSWSAVDTALAIHNIQPRAVGATKIDDDPRFPAIREAIASGMSKTKARKAFKISGTLIRRALGETERAKKVEKKRIEPADEKLAREVEEAIRRDAAWLRARDARRNIARMAA